jgi:demethylmenaquinone methyltransferase / 2-methoxy-6-polyprenyl-1,4-benzoquinol methylase
MTVHAEPERPIWDRREEEKRAAVQRMFGEIAPTYDLLNGMMSLSLHHRWRAFAVRQLHLRPGDRALDVCCGTGDFLRPLERAVGAEGKVAGLDFSRPMLDRARRKVRAGLLLGDACRLPVRERSFDGVSVGWGIRNVPDVDEAHRELFRVLRGGGRFVSLDMARPRNPLLRAGSGFMFHRLVPLLGRLFGKREAYTYLPKSTDSFLTREELAESMRRAGFVDVGWKDLMLGNVCVHWGRRP